MKKFAHIYFIFSLLLAGIGAEAQLRCADLLSGRPAKPSVQQPAKVRDLRTFGQAMTEGMGPIMDRRKEHLGTSDLAVIAARRILLRMVRELADGVEPFAASHGNLYRVRALDAVTHADTIEAVVAEFRDELEIRPGRSARLTVPLAKTEA